MLAGLALAQVESGNVSSTRFRLDISYDGTDFHGWAHQEGLRTVQGTIEHWITTVLRLDEPAQLTVAGRTDAGVHARAQVAHADLPSDVDPRQLRRRLTRILPEDVRVNRISVAPEHFDARFSALWRRYVYRVWDVDSFQDPLLRGFTSPVRHSLDIARMNEACDQLLGLNDFVAFCKYREGATSIRCLQKMSVKRADDRCGTIEMTVQADAFCHSMVRSLAGALCSVGSGQRSVKWISNLLSATKRSSEVLVMPARGLTLEEVAYPSDDKLAERISQAKSKRVLPGKEQR